MDRVITEAIRKGDIEFLKEFFKKNNPNDPITQDDDGMTVLHLASGMDSEKRDEIIKFILSYPDVDINKPSGKTNDWWTAAHFAASWGYAESLEILLKHNADPYILDCHCRNVWDIAGEYERCDCIHVLKSSCRKLDDTILILDSSAKSTDADYSYVSEKDGDERIKHVDKIFNITVIEETRRKSTVSTGLATANLDDTIVNLSDTELRLKLLEKGESPGPIVSTTRDIYRRRLQRLIQRKICTNIESPAKELTSLLDNLDLNEKKEELCITRQKQMPLPSYSIQLNSFIDPEFNFKEVRQLEKNFVDHFKNSRRKESFNYLLLDPRKIPTPSESIGPITFDPILFKKLINSIFYVGKGSANRPYMHLYEAALVAYKKKIISKKGNKKVEKILEIWNDDCGIISLRMFQNISSEEAYARERLIIEAIGITNLTNVQAGQNRIALLAMNHCQRKLLGSYFIYKAYWAYLADEKNQLKREHIRC